MADSEVPPDAPPTYSAATAGSSSRPAAQSGSSNLSVTGRNEKGSIPASARRSMEDETRPLPPGWVRTFDPDSHHQFFVDTKADPPRSIWVHPYDDEKYLSTLSSEERERIEQESLHRGSAMPSHDDIIAAHSDDDDNMDDPSSGTKSGELPPRPDKGASGDGRSFGRKWKDKITGTTHQEREAQRQKRAEQERKMYEQHQVIRRAMAEAQRTGQPVHIGKDKDGKDVYVEPPSYGGGGYGGYGGYGGGYGYDPYGRGGVYNTPNARYIRPPNPYSRPYGYGYGGGYGFPLAGGLLGGLLLTDLLI